MNIKGSVLVIVLLMISGILSVVLLRGESVLAEYKEVTRLQDSLQSYVYCSTTIKGLAKVLEEDDNYYDAPDELWASVSSIPTADGYVSITVIPLNSKISLLSLVSNNKSLEDRIERAFNALGIDINIDTLKSSFEKKPPYSIGELRFRENISEEFLSTHVLSKFTVEETKGKLNINFADKEVISAYLPELEAYVDDIISYRSNTPFKDVSELRRVPGITDDIYLQVQPFITVKSSVFYVYVESLVRNTLSSASAVIKRTDGKVKIIKYFEGKKEYYASG